MKIDKLIDEYEKRAERIGNELKNCVASGSAPDYKFEASLHESIRNLREKYGEIISFVEKRVLPEEMPKKGSSIYDYKNALDRSSYYKQNKSLDEAAEYLAYFINLKGKAPFITKSMEPFQAQVKDLLDAIQLGEVEKIDDIENEIRGPKLFIEALFFDNFFTKEHLYVLEQLSTYYPSNILSYLAGKSLYCEELNERIEVLHEKRRKEEMADLRNILKDRGVTFSE